MPLGKLDQLNEIIQQLISDSRGALTNCVITNERGLVVAGISTDGSSQQDLAAMISLLSDTAVRVNGNLGFGKPIGVQIRGLGVSISLHEFLVQNRPFKIGAIVQEGHPWRTMFRQKPVHQIVVNRLQKAATQIRKVLEK